MFVVYITVSVTALSTELTNIHVLTIIIVEFCEEPEIANGNVAVAGDGLLPNRGVNATYSCDAGYRLRPGLSNQRSCTIEDQRVKWSDDDTSYERCELSEFRADERINYSRV